MASSDQTIVDLYCHIVPEAFFEEMNRVAPDVGKGNVGARLRGITKLFDVDERMREMDALGDYRQVISLPGPPMPEMGTPEVGLQLARIGNDGMADLCAKHPDKFAAFVGELCLTDAEGSIEEAQRAVKELGAAGVQCTTNIAGKPLDLPEFEPFFAAVAELDVPLWLHPARGASSMPDYVTEEKSRFEMWWCFGWPYETSVAMMRLTFSGLFDRYPNLDVITHHLGGMIPYYDGRAGIGMEVLGGRTQDEDYSEILPSLKRPHMEYLKEFYGDTALFGGSVGPVECGLKFFGSEHVVFATDTPLGPIQPAIDVVNELDIDEADRTKIFSGNAARLLKTTF